MSTYFRCLIQTIDGNDARNGSSETKV